MISATHFHPTQFHLPTILALNPPPLTKLQLLHTEIKTQLHNEAHETIQAQKEEKVSTPNTSEEAREAAKEIVKEEERLKMLKKEIIETQGKIDRKMVEQKITTTIAQMRKGINKIYSILQIDPENAQEIEAGSINQPDNKATESVELDTKSIERATTELGNVLYLYNTAKTHPVAIDLHPKVITLQTFLHNISLQNLDVVLRPFASINLPVQAEINHYQDAARTLENTEPLMAFLQPYIMKAFTDFESLQTFFKTRSEPPFTAFILDVTPQKLRLPFAIFEAVLAIVHSKKDPFGYTGKHYIRNYYAVQSFVTFFMENFVAESDAAEFLESSLIQKLLRALDTAIYFQIHFRDLTTTLEKDFTFENVLSSIRTLWDPESMYLPCFNARAWKSSLSMLEVLRAQMKAQPTATLDEAVQKIRKVGIIPGDITNLFVQHIKPKLLKVELQDAALKEILEEFQAIAVQETEKLSQQLADNALENVNQAKIVVQQYRRSGKVVSEPSYYVPSILEEVTAFYEKWHVDVTMAVNIITGRYQEVVTETLTNLFKVADSLKKLQRRNKGKEEQGTEEDDDSRVLSTSDEGKCVLQYELDVEAFGKKISSLGISASKNADYLSLKSAIQTIKAERVRTVS